MKAAHAVATTPTATAPPRSGRVFSTVVAASSRTWLIGDREWSAASAVRAGGEQAVEPDGREPAPLQPSEQGWKRGHERVALGCGLGVVEIEGDDRAGPGAVEYVLRDLAGVAGASG